jgi:hypothetical protein
MEFTSDSAKQFLLSKLTEQAMHDEVALDETEKTMFLYSESCGSPNLEAQEKFDTATIPRPTSPRLQNCFADRTLATDRLRRASHLGKLR